MLTAFHIANEFIIFIANNHLLLTFILLNDVNLHSYMILYTLTLQTLHDDIDIAISEKNQGIESNNFAIIS